MALCRLASVIAAQIKKLETSEERSQDLKAFAGANLCSKAEEPSRELMATEAPAAESTLAWCSVQAPLPV